MASYPKHVNHELSPMDCPVALDDVDLFGEGAQEHWYEAYEILHWDRALTTPYKTRPIEHTSAAGRWEFVARVAEDAVRQKYLGRSVRSHLTPGSRNPIVYVGVPQ